MFQNYFQGSLLAGTKLRSNLSNQYVNQLGEALLFYSLMHHPSYHIYPPKKSKPFFLTHLFRQGRHKTLKLPVWVFRSTFLQEYFRKDCDGACS